MREAQVTPQGDIRQDFPYIAKAHTNAGRGVSPTIRDIPWLDEKTELFERAQAVRLEALIGHIQR